MTDHLKASPPERYEEISRHLLEQAQDESDKGDTLQSSSPPYPRGGLDGQLGAQYYYD